MYIILTKAF